MTDTVVLLLLLFIFVLLPEGKPLLGVISLEFMDLIVDPIRRELVGTHGDEAVLMAM